jgi:hypothetical protein
LDEYPSMPSDLLQASDIKIIPQKKLKGNDRSLPQTSLSRSQLVETVARILDGMIEERFGKYVSVDEVPNRTVFHASKLPPISLKDYLNRFATFSNCNEDAFVYALIYLDKVGDNIEDFSLDSFNSHRLILICLVLACKFYDDYYYKNSFYAKIGGVVTEEFNQLEKEFLLNYIQFALYVKVETYAEYYQDLIDYYQTNVQGNEAR